MKRELWSIGSTFAYGIKILNSIFCEEDNETELSKDEKWLVAEQVNSMCSKMMIEDAQDMLAMVSSMEQGRLCERTDCSYHHPENPHTHTYRGMFMDKCEDCIENQKSKLDKSDRMDHFETL